MAETIFHTTFSTSQFLLSRAKNGSESGLRSAVSYRFGFNGKEKVDELFESSGSAYDFGARLYDSRLGRWMACDPLAVKYPGYSPYHFGYCDPIIVMDPNGKENVIVLGSTSNKPGLATRKTIISEGVDEAVKIYDRELENGTQEKTTILLYKANYTQEEINSISKKIGNRNIQIIQIASPDELINYIATKDVKGADVKTRLADLISEFIYVGHSSAKKIPYLWLDDYTGFYSKHIQKIKNIANPFTWDAYAWFISCESAKSTPSSNPQKPNPSIAERFARTFHIVAKGTLTTITLSTRKSYSNWKTFSDRKYPEMEKMQPKEVKSIEYNPETKNTSVITN